MRIVILAILFCASALASAADSETEALASKFYDATTAKQIEQMVNGMMGAVL